MLLRNLVKLFVAAGLLWVIAGRVDFGDAFRIIASADPALIALAMALSLAIAVFDAAYWAASLTAIGCRIAFAPALALSLVSTFFANLAPSNLGADLFRAAQMRAAGATIEQAVRIASAARLMSYASLVAVIGAGLPVALSLVSGDAEKLALIAVYAGALAAFGGFLLFGPMATRIDFGVVARAARFVANLSRDTRRLLASATAAGWSYLTAQHLLRVAGVAAIAAALGAEADFLALFALIPAALLVAMIPISFGGWGVREASFVSFLGLAGLAPETALAISIVFGLTRVALGVVGGVIFVIMRNEDYRFAFDAEAPAERAGPTP